jgi:hypothetical protein
MSLILSEFDGVSAAGVWERQAPSEPDFKFEVSRTQLKMFATSDLNQHLVRRGIAIDAARPYAVEGLFTIPPPGRPHNSFCVNLNVAGPDGDLGSVNCWALNVHVLGGGGSLTRFMGFVDGRFHEMGHIENTWGEIGREYSFRAHVNAGLDGTYQPKLVSMTVHHAGIPLSRFEIDYSPFPYQPVEDAAVRLGLNTHFGDWVLKNLRASYLVTS